MNRKKIPKLIDKFCGVRPKNAKYSFSNIIMGWMYCMLCGAKRIEDSNKLRQVLKIIPDEKFSSPDRIGDILKKFSTPAEQDMSRGIDNQICQNDMLQDMLLTTAVKLGVLKKGVGYDLDYDTIVIPTEKTDSRSTLKKYRGYNPAVSFIGKTPVYIHGRNGNSSPRFMIKNTLKKTFDSLKKHGIEVKRVRMDSASYNFSLMNYLDTRGKDFFIRSYHSTKMHAEIKDPSLKWEKIQMGTETLMVTSMLYNPDGKFCRDFRLVVGKRELYSNAVRNRYDEKEFIFGIITNDYSMTDKEVIAFYNKRGDMERNFDQLLNDFNWRRLPFSFMNQNLTFMYVSAICKVIYHHVLDSFSKTFTDLKNNIRLKKFIGIFMNVVSAWEQVGGEWKLELYTGNLLYDKLFKAYNDS